jgi:5-methylcytosine-specific restriction endonuclease McrA
VHFTATAEVRDKLTLAQDLLRHQIPNGDIGKILDRALTLLLEHLARQKFAATDRPRARPADQPAAGSSSTRHIPAEVKRAVWLRDGGRCAFVAENGRRCEERGFLEFHHVVPVSNGGTATTGNLALRCRAHNAYEATLLFAGLHRYERGDTVTPQGAAPGPSGPSWSGPSPSTAVQVTNLGASGKPIPEQHEEVTR